jgi:hypothetical protein
MGFWIFMLIMTVLIPLSMILLGDHFISQAKESSSVPFGYKTAMSMKNKETWQFAHQTGGRLWNRVGWFMLFLTAPAMIMFVGESNNFVGIYAAIVCVVQLMLLVGTLFLVEKNLNKAFDKNGNRRM